MSDILRAKELLKNANCALVKGEIEYVSKERGISPMMLWLEEGKSFEGFSAADKIVGRALAMLFTKVKVKEVYAEVLSNGALEYLKEKGIPVNYATLTDKIINREGNDICPMEKTVMSIEDFEEGYRALLIKWQSLRGK